MSDSVLLCGRRLCGNLFALLAVKFLSGGARNFQFAVICWNYRSLGDYDRYGRDRGGEKPTAAASLCRRF